MKNLWVHLLILMILSLLSTEVRAQAIDSLNIRLELSVEDFQFNIPLQPQIDTFEVVITDTLYMWDKVDSLQAIVDQQERTLELLFADLDSLQSLPPDTVYSVDTLYADQPEWRPMFGPEDSLLVEEGSRYAIYVRDPDTLTVLYDEGEIDYWQVEIGDTVHTGFPTDTLSIHRIAYDTALELGHYYPDFVQLYEDYERYRKAALPDTVDFVEIGGHIELEAEDYTETTAGSGIEWIPIVYQESDSMGAMHAFDSTASVNTGDATTGPRLSYEVSFTTPGTYYVWVRIGAPDESSNSIHIGLDGQPVTYGGLGVQTNNLGDFYTWEWQNEVSTGQVVTLDVTEGVHWVDVWMREEGVRLDKIILTTDPNFQP